MVRMGCVAARFQDLGLVVIFGFFCWLRVASAFSREFVMTEYCGDLIDMEQRYLTTARVRLTQLPAYRPRLSCSFGVRAPTAHRLTMVVQWLDIAEGRFHVCSDYLSVWNGDFNNKTGYVEGMDGKTCGKVTPPSVTSQGRSLLLHFDSNTIEDGAGFSVVFTAFHQGNCRRDEFSCDNGRCIDIRLKCDDYDNCGDNSDDCILSVGGVVVAVIVTTIVFLLIIGIAVLYCHRDKLKLRKKCPIIGANPDGVYQPTTEPVRAPSAEATTAV
ncbi:hypothetical protein ACOMHN_044618 [Nucella lapillus]